MRMNGGLTLSPDELIGMKQQSIDEITRSTTYRNAIVIRQGRTGRSASAIAQANPTPGGQAHEQD